MHHFTHTRVPTPICILDESNGSHMYISPSGKRLPGVTTMINQTISEEKRLRLQDWKQRIGVSVADYIFSESAIIGTETHKLNQNYINMIESNEKYHLLSYAHHSNFIPYLDKITNVYGVESRLFSEKLGLAGTADVIAEYDGKLSIIDYKTKRSSQVPEWMTDYFIQTTAYSVMWQELTNQKIEQLVIIASSEQNTIQEFIGFPSEYLNALNSRLIQFKKL
jgi:genome maintenance exonuclease 1